MDDSIDQIAEDLEPKLYIKRLAFNDGTVLDLGHSDIIVITGPNNSGKSRVLKDIYDFYRYIKTPQIVVKDIQLEYVGHPDEDFVKRYYMWNGQSYVFDGYGISELNQFISSWDNKSVPLVGRVFIDFLTTEGRLQAASTTESINPRIEYPAKPLQRLIRQDTIEHLLSDLFEKAFGERICIDRGMGSQIALVMGKDISPRKGEDRVSESFLTRLSELPTIDVQGDGIRSFVGILLHLLTSDKSVTLIDEPEAFLHPPQARVLGEMIAERGKEQTLIATHSEDFLKGILDRGGDRVKIIRITRNGDINPISRLESAQIKTVWSDPILKFSPLLSGLFHQKVVICEADTDCRFYQAMMSTLVENEGYVKPDILFTYSGGKERLKVMAAALKPLQVPVIVVADMDIMDDKGKFKALTDALSITWESIESDWKEVFEYIRSQRPQLETDDVKKEINKLLSQVTETVLPKAINEKIRKILKQSSAWGKVKESGKNYLIGNPYRAFIRLDEKCRKSGLFIVPVGQLESFYAPSSAHGTQWVNSVLAQVDLKQSEELREAREFVEAIIEYK